MLKNIRSFNPLKLDEFVCPKAHSYFEGQKIAFEMAKDDFYVMNPDFPRLANEEAPLVPEENLVVEEASSEDVVEQKVEKPAAAKRKRPKSVSAKKTKTKRARITKPEPRDFDMVSSESGEEVDAEFVPEVAPQESEKEFEPNEEAVADDADMDSDKVFAPHVKPKKVSKSASAKKSAKAMSKQGKKGKGLTSDKPKIKSLQRQVKLLRAELDRSTNLNSDLERRLKKAKHMRKNSERVKFMLPEVRDELPREVPVESERGTRKVNADEFETLGSKCHTVYNQYEALLKECGIILKGLKADAQTAEAQLQITWDKVAVTMLTMENAEKKLASLLRSLYRANISCENGPGETSVEVVTKCVKRIIRRTGDNSVLVGGLAQAIIDSWNKEWSKTRPLAASGKQSPVEDTKSLGVTPEANTKPEIAATEIAIDVKDSPNRDDGDDAVKDEVGTRKKDRESASDDRMENRQQQEMKKKDSGEEENGDAMVVDGSAKEDSDGDPNAEEKARSGTGKEDPVHFEDSDGERNVSGNHEAVDSHQSTGNLRDVPNRTESKSEPEIGGNGDGDKNNTLVADENTDVKNDSPEREKSDSPGREKPDSHAEEKPDSPINEKSDSPVNEKSDSPDKEKPEERLGTIKQEAACDIE